MFKIEAKYWTIDFVVFLKEFVFTQIHSLYNNLLAIYMYLQTYISNTLLLRQ